MGLAVGAGVTVVVRVAEFDRDVVGVAVGAGVTDRVRVTLTD